MPPKFRSATMHSIGRQALVNAGLWTSLDKSKLYNLALELFENVEDKNLLAPVLKLTAAAKTYGIFPHAYPNSLTPNDPASFEELAEHFSLPFSNEIHDHTQSLLSLSVEASLKGVHDFDDMLMIPLLKRLGLSTAGIVIVDEAQDLSSIQHELLSRMVMRGGRLIAAGDPHQAIYGFRGALSDSFSSLSRRFNSQIMPLTVSFRCPQAVVALAQQYVPEIQPHPDAPLGEIHYHSSGLISDIPPITLCRFNAPLVQLALRLITEGYTAEVVGRDIGKGLISLMKKISKKNLDSPTFISRLNTWAEKEITKKPRSKSRVRDKQETLTAIARTYPDMRSIQAHLDKLYPDPSSRSYKPAQYTLSTIHRAKGLEWPSVGILDYHSMPSRFAEQEWELQQEQNLAYVALTRSQNALHFINSEDYK
jgi:superfamily I DNA/RNA helicase